MKLYATTAQTVGPFFHVGFKWLFSDHVANADAEGQHVIVQGRVLDGDAAPVPDAVIEIWQADAQGQYAHPDDKRGRRSERDFKGFARVPTDDDGVFRFSTIIPGCVPAPDGGLQAPHLGVTVLMRGLLRQLVTRMYFPDASDNGADMVLKQVPPDRRQTLIARRSQGVANVLEWNIVLQGDHETVFFDY